MKNNELNKVRINNRICYYFDDIVKFEDFNFDNVLIEEKSYENISIYDISHRILIGAKPLRIRFNKIDEFINVIIELYI